MGKQCGEVVKLILKYRVLMRLKRNRCLAKAWKPRTLARGRVTPAQPKLDSKSSETKDNFS